MQAGFCLDGRNRGLNERFHPEGAVRNGAYGRSPAGGEDGYGELTTGISGQGGAHFVHLMKTPARSHLHS